MYIIYISTFDFIDFFRIRGESDPGRADFERKCVVALLKRLRRTHDPKIIRNLKATLKTKSYKSACITIPKSLDGRIQVRIWGHTNIAYTMGHDSWPLL